MAKVSKYLIVLALWSVTWSVPVAASELEIIVRDQTGGAIADAVITVKMDAGVETPSFTQKVVTIDQKDEAFSRSVSLLHPGDAVQFKNSDNVLHHVYSFAKQHPFDMLVRRNQLSSTIVYDRDDVVAVGCNIHDNMLTYVYITDSPFAVQSDEEGRARLEDLPLGEAMIKVWHPRAKGSDKAVFVPAKVSEDGPSLDVTLPLFFPQRHKSSRY